MINITLLGLGPLLVLAVGFGLLWFDAHRGRASTSPGAPWRLALRVFGWLSLLLGVLAAVCITSNFLFFFGVLAVVLVGGMLRHRCTDAERQTLAWLLMKSAERGLPLETAARAFAAEHQGALQSRAQKLADYLDAGLPLSLALERSGNRLAPPFMLAADMGQRSGTLGAALREALRQEDETSKTMQSISAGVLYFAGVTVVTVAAVTFLQIKIAPVQNLLLIRQDMPTPPITQALSDTSTAAVGSWAWLLTGVGMVLLLLAFLNQVGYSLRRIPVVRRLWWRADCALVMQWLAVSVRQGRPILDTLRALAVYFPLPKMRHRLDRVASRLDRGENWCDGLRRGGLIRRVESVVFKSAERTGNLPWALDEMATSSLRRAAWRLRAWFAIAFPLTMLVFGGIVLFIALAMWQPIITLIRGLT